MPTLMMPALFLIMPAKQAWRWITVVIVVSSLFLYVVLHALNHLFMFTALVPTLVFLSLLVASFFASHRTARSEEARTDKADARIPSA